jgi:hypothetical protein
MGRYVARRYAWAFHARLKAPMEKPFTTYVDWLEPFVDLPKVKG